MVASFATSADGAQQTQPGAGGLDGGDGSQCLAIKCGAVVGPTIDMRPSDGLVVVHGCGFGGV
jgi:hypothetical protein